MHRLIAFVYHSEVTFRVDPVEVSHFRYENSLIARGELHFAKDGLTFALAAIQVAGQDSGKLIYEMKADKK